MTLTVATSLAETLRLLADGARPIAGGTDLVVAARSGKAPLPQHLVAIDRLDELIGWVEVDGGIRIGAATSHQKLLVSDIVADRYTGLADAAALIGSPATRHLGTIGGNIMNASPAMDTGAPLVTLNAEIELESVDGRRRVPVADLWVAPGRTVAAANELCTGVVLPDPLAHWPEGARHGSAYIRLEYRRAMEIAVVGAAASVTVDPNDQVLGVSVALSAVGPTIMALTDCDLAGFPATHDPSGTNNPSAADEVRTLAQEQATPISDLRASDRYRRHCVGVLAARAFEAAVARAHGDPLSIPANRSHGVGAETGATQ